MSRKTLNNMKTMIKNNKLCLLLTLICFYGCRDRLDAEWPKITVLDHEIKNNAKLLKAEIIEASHDYVSAISFFAYNDSIMIISNKESNDVYFVEFCNLNSNTITNRFIRMGNGPGEMLGTELYIRQNVLTVRDPVKCQVAEINIDSALYYPDYRIARFVKYDNSIVTSCAMFFGANEIIMTNPDRFKDDELNICYDEPRFITTKIGETTAQKPNDHRYSTDMVSRGIIAYNNDKSKVIFASYDLDEIELYDGMFNPVMLIKGPDHLKSTYAFIDNMIIGKSPFPLSYRNVYSEAQYFYLSYVGEYDTPDSKWWEHDSYIFKFDWDGNFIESFHVPKYINTITKSPDGDIFYGSSFDEDGTPVLWRLTAE
jgi:hypothetical protein